MCIEAFKKFFKRKDRQDSKKVDSANAHYILEVITESDRGDV